MNWYFVIMTISLPFSFAGGFSGSGWLFHNLCTLLHPLWLLLLFFIIQWGWSQTLWCWHHRSSCRMCSCCTSHRWPLSLDYPLRWEVLVLAVPQLAVLSVLRLVVEAVDVASRKKLAHLLSHSPPLTILPPLPLLLPLPLLSFSLSSSSINVFWLGFLFIIIERWGSEGSALRNSC